MDGIVGVKKALKLWRSQRDVDSREKRLLDILFREIKRHKLLTHEEQAELGKLARVESLDEEIQLGTGDTVARNKLVAHNLRFLVWVAQKYKGGSLPLLDIIQEGAFGLIAAAEKYNGDRGKFSTYAVWWISLSISRAFDNHSTQIRLPSHVHERNSKIWRRYIQLSNELNREPTIPELAAELELSEEEASRRFEEIKLKVLKLDDPISPDDDSRVLFDIVPDQSVMDPSQICEAKDELRMLIKKIQGNLMKLIFKKESEKEIFALRYGLDGLFHERTLQEVGDNYSLTRERIRQIIEVIWTRSRVNKLVVNESWMLAKLKELNFLREITYEMLGPDCFVLPEVQPYVFKKSFRSLLSTPSFFDPYDYQQIALDRTKETFKVSDRALIVMATGLGKTVVSSLFAKDEVQQGKRGLFLCHDTDILDNAVQKFKVALGPEAKLRKFYGGAKDRNADTADVLFASFQIFAGRESVFSKDHFDFVIVDESHHGYAPTYAEVINYFEPAKLLGMTATKERMDGQDICDIFGPEVINYSLEEAIAKDWLTPIEYMVLNDGINTERLNLIANEVKEGKRRLSVKQLNENFFIEARDEEVVQTVLDNSLDKKTIIFCSSIYHADYLSVFFPNSKTFHYKNSPQENKRILDDFHKGRLQYILAVNKFNEGIDVPDAEVIVFLRETKSKTIFLQQLGRGLRKCEGKDSVLILDFVANCQRLSQLSEINRNIGKFTKSTAAPGTFHGKEKFHLVGDGFDFIFSLESIEILELIRRAELDFYPTWQQASKAAIGLGVTKQDEYSIHYKKDSRLPSHPADYYDDFPDWATYLGKRSHHGYYRTWEEASMAAIALKVKNVDEYRDVYHQDLKLPGDPHSFYSDFPGYKEFLGTAFYVSWEEAAVAARELGFKTKDDYKDGYRKDSKLPSNPYGTYGNFPGWKIFLGKKGRMVKNRDHFYATWQEASDAVVRLGIKNWEDYFEKYLTDEKLPREPHQVYEDYPGFYKFFKVKYETWEDASEAAKKLGIRSHDDYREKYRYDPKLPSNLTRFYKDFPGYRVFLGAT